MRGSKGSNCLQKGFSVRLRLSVCSLPANRKANVSSDYVKVTRHTRCYVPQMQWIYFTYPCGKERIDNIWYREADWESLVTFGAGQSDFFTARGMIWNQWEEHYAMCHRVWIELSLKPVSSWDIMISQFYDILLMMKCSLLIKLQFLHRRCSCNWLQVSCFCHNFTLTVAIATPPQRMLIW